MNLVYFLFFLFLYFDLFLVLIAVYHTYVIFSLLGRYVDVEVRTPKGRVDMVMNSGKALYLFELKLNKSAEAAMNQINLKDYPSRFALAGLPVIKVGINFNSETHTIEDWVIDDK